MEKKMRRARMEDIQAIRAIDGEIGGVMGLEIAMRPVEYYEDWLRFHRSHKRCPAFVGTEDGKVIWWVALGEYPGGYPFDGVAVVEMGIPERIATPDLTDLMLRFLEQQAIRLGYYKLIVCLDAEQRYLLHTYRRVGFRDVGTLRSHGYCKGKLVDLVVMERLLAADMNALEEYYSDRYRFYREYFDRLHRQQARSASPVEEDYAQQYEEIDTPEDQLPEGIVRFLRTKKPPEGVSPADLSPEGEGEEELEGEVGQENGEPAPPAPAAQQPQLPEGIIRFLKSKKLPDGSPANPELPPIVPVKLSPAQRRWAEAALADEEKQQQEQEQEQAEEQEQQEQQEQQVREEDPDE